MWLNICFAVWLCILWCIKVRVLSWFTLRLKDCANMVIQKPINWAKCHWSSTIYPTPIKNGMFFIDFTMKTCTSAVCFWYHGLEQSETSCFLLSDSSEVWLTQSKHKEIKLLCNLFWPNWCLKTWKCEEYVRLWSCVLYEVLMWRVNQTLLINISDQLQNLGTWGASQLNICVAREPNVIPKLKEWNMQQSDHNMSTVFSRFYCFCTQKTEGLDSIWSNWKTWKKTKQSIKTSIKNLRLITFLTFKAFC